MLGGCTFDRAGTAARDGAGTGQGDLVALDLRTESGRADLSADAGALHDGPRTHACKRITVKAQLVTGSLTDFPLLVQVSADAELAAGAKSDGSDIVFRSPDGATPYACEIERYDGASGDLVAWVKLPALSSQADAELLLCYGGSSTPLPASGVWSNGYAGVWHLTGAGVVDSGPSSLTATIKGTTTQTPGKLGDGRSFDTQPTSWIELGDPTLTSSAPFTLELWFRPKKSQSAWIGLASKGRDTDQEWIGVYLKPDKLLSFGWSWQSPGAGNLDSNGTKPAAGVWHHVFATFDGTLARLYYNGVQDADSPKGQGYDTLAGPLVLGTDRFDNNPSFDGVVDEVRLSSVARDAAWIATQYANQSDPSAFITVGPEEAL